MISRRDAYLTVYLSISLTLILSFYLTLIEGARRNGARLEAACITETSVNSVMAEYNRALAERYNIYAVDSSYGTDTGGRNNAEAHLLCYMRENQGTSEVLLGEYLYKDFFGLETVDAELEQMQLLTDDGGAVFRKAAVEALGDDTGLNLFDKVQQWVSVIRLNGLMSSDPEEQISNLQENISEAIGSDKEISEVKYLEIPAEKIIKQLTVNYGSGLFGRLVEDANISQNLISDTYLFSKRRNRGEISLGNWEEESTGLADRFCFQEYLLRYMGNYLEARDGSALQYQVEYLICGDTSDHDNLKSVLKRILVVRAAANASYLFGDEIKMKEVEAAATLISSIVGLPELTPVLETLIVALWAEAEGEYDVRCLLKGQKVPLLKDEKTWHYSLLQFFSGGDGEDGENTDGMSYADYLRVLMYFCDTETLTARALNMVEADIRLTKGNASFRADACYTAIKAAVRLQDCKGCNYEAVRQRSY